MMKAIENIADIKVLVNEFYNKIRADKDLAPVFNSKIEKNDWERHLNRMYLFWDTLLFHKSGYKGNPFAKHANLPVEQFHFDKWVALFVLTVNENFIGEKANDAKQKAKSIAYIFSNKIMESRR